MSQGDVHTFSFQLLGDLGTTPIGTVDKMRMKVPTNAQGGGITVTDFGVVSAGSIAIGSAPAYQLVTRTTANVVVATICTQVGSLGYPAGSALAGSVNGTYSFVDPDTAAWVVVVQNTDPIGSVGAGVWGYISYVMGK